MGDYSTIPKEFPTLAVKLVLRDIDASKSSSSSSLPTFAHPLDVSDKVGLYMLRPRLASG